MVECSLCGDETDVPLNIVTVRETDIVNQTGEICDTCQEHVWMSVKEVAEQITDETGATCGKSL